jgi:hypothetical protein
MKPFVASKQELDCIKDNQPMPETHDLDGSNVSP